MLFLRPDADRLLCSRSSTRYVYIKAVPLSSSEWQIIQFLSTDPLRADIRNHTIPNVSMIPAGEWGLHRPGILVWQLDVPPF